MRFDYNEELTAQAQAFNECCGKPYGRWLLSAAGLSNIINDAMRYEAYREKLAKVTKALRDLFPFVEEDYYPNCATPAFKAAMEQAYAVLGIKPRYAEDQIDQTQAPMAKDIADTIEGKYQPEQFK